MRTPTSTTPEAEPIFEPFTIFTYGPVTVRVDNPFLSDVAPDDLAQAVWHTLRAEGREDAEVTLVITGDQEMAELNRQFLGAEGPTDVLSFPAQEPTPGFVSAAEAAGYLGDVVIALPFTRRQSAALGRPLADELRLLAIHGVLHLLGYDHADPVQEAAMWARQDEILAGLLKADQLI